MKVVIIDKKLKEFGKEFFILWESKSFFHLGIYKNQAIANLYCGKSQCKYN